MARPLRIEFPGGLYHVTTCGDRREAIYLSDADRQYWLDLLGNVCTRHNWLCHANCLMDNHFHIIEETIDGYLSAGMRQLNGVYTHWHNRTHTPLGSGLAIIGIRRKSGIIRKFELSEAKKGAA